MKKMINPNLTVAEREDAGLMSRAYNLGLKAIANLPHILRESDLIFWEKNVHLLKAALGGFRQKEEKMLPKLERMINNVSITIGEKIKNLSSEYKEGRMTEAEFRKKINFDLNMLINGIRPSRKRDQLVATALLTQAEITKLERDLEELEVGRFTDIEKEDVDGESFHVKLTVLAAAANLFHASLKDGMLHHDGWDKKLQIIPRVAQCTKVTD